MICRESVSCEVGQNAILLCHLEPEWDVTGETVMWELNDETVHRYPDGKDVQAVYQHERFHNRTSLFREELVHGNVSLQLLNVTEEDVGNYTCRVTIHVKTATKKISNNQIIPLRIGECFYLRTL